MMKHTVLTAMALIIGVGIATVGIVTVGSVPPAEAHSAPNHNNNNQCRCKKDNSSDAHGGAGTYHYHYFKCRNGSLVRSLKHTAVCYADNAGKMMCSSSYKTSPQTPSC